MRSIFPTITPSRQALFEKVVLANPHLPRAAPEICGVYGRACRCMNRKADRMPCRGCALALFASTADSILECCEQKEKRGHESLHDSDMFDIHDSLAKKAVHVEVSYIDELLDCLLDA